MLKFTVYSWIACLLLILAVANCAAGEPQATVAVTVTDTGDAYVLANGIITARVAKSTGGVESLKYNDLECLHVQARHPGGYWSHTPAGAHVIDSITIDPKANAGQRGEISVKGIYEKAPLGAGPGGSTDCDIEIRYALAREESALYTYCIFTHKPEYPDTAIGEARFALKLNPKVYDWMTIDDRRNKSMANPADWENGTQLNMKEARRLNTGIYAGQVEHKYDYSAVQFDTPAFGWSSTKEHVGLWLINPSAEYLSGGATKVELTGHLDGTGGGVPVLLNYWRGSHYGGSQCTIAAGENWTKVIGPFLIYCDSGSSPNATWKRALVRAREESARWPYDWVAGVDYSDKNHRADVSGQIILADPQDPAAHMSNLLIGLASPDVPSTPAINGIVDWQQDAKHYEFWTRPDAENRFIIPSVRPGNYTLHAIADGVLGEFALEKISVIAGQPLDLGKLQWKPTRFGRQLWEIGYPDRTAGKYRHGDHYWQWGLYNDYGKEFPNDVQFTIGKSDYRTDWNYAQIPNEKRPTTWTIHFTLADAPRGNATLRLAFASNSARKIAVAVNDQSAGVVDHLPDTATIRRDGIRGYWFERDVAFDAALMKAGEDTISLTIPAANVLYGVQYDYLRLELGEK